MGPICLSPSGGVPILQFISNNLKFGYWSNMAITLDFFYPHMVALKSSIYTFHFLQLTPEASRQ